MSLNFEELSRQIEVGDLSHSFLGNADIGPESREPPPRLRFPHFAYFVSSVVKPMFIPFVFNLYQYLTSIFVSFALLW
jgi:hypothetical protein